VLGVKFTPSSDHARAWRYYKVRPQAGAAHPERTKAKYCIWDEPHNDWVYTDAWITKLTTELRDPAKFEEVVGHRPVALPDIQTDLLPTQSDESETAAATAAH